MDYLLLADAFDSIDFVRFAVFEGLVDNSEGSLSESVGDHVLSEHLAFFVASGAGSF